MPFAVLALVVAAFMGYAAVAYRLGNWAHARFGRDLKSPYLAVLLGVVAIQIWSLFADLLDFGGGPLNSYVLHAIARICHRVAHPIDEVVAVAAHHLALAA